MKLFSLNPAKANATSHTGKTENVAERWISEKKKQEQVPVVIACDQQGHVSDCIPKKFDTENIHRFLEPITDSDSILCTDGAGCYRIFASAHGLSHYRVIKLNNQRVIDNVFHIQHVNGYISRLKGWMKRFHGVGTGISGELSCLEKVV